MKKYDNYIDAICDTDSETFRTAFVVWRGAHEMIKSNDCPTFLDFINMIEKRKIYIKRFEADGLLKFLSEVKGDMAVFWAVVVASWCVHHEELKTKGYNTILDWAKGSTGKQ